MDDRALVERQLGRPPRALRSVVVRCPYGRPAVTEQAPFDSEGEPFPTTFYLTCPQLVSRIATLEAAGGVEAWSARAREDPALGASLRAANEEQRELRRELAGGREHPSLELGVGGSGRSGSLKCLHAHAAYALARPGYRLGEAILAELGPLWPSGACCLGEAAS
jgi:hypothetical protein